MVAFETEGRHSFDHSRYTGPTRSDLVQRSTVNSQIDAPVSTRIIARK